MGVATRPRTGCGGLVGLVGQVSSGALVFCFLFFWGGGLGHQGLPQGPHHLFSFCWLCEGRGWGTLREPSVVKCKSGGAGRDVAAVYAMVDWVRWRYAT